MVTVSVDATWRMSRVELNAPYDPMMGAVVGYGEYLLQEPAGAPPEGSLMRRRAAPTGSATTYGTMSTDPISRTIDTVKDETVDVGGTTISFTTVLEALGAFFRKWSVEDSTKPPPPLPQGVPLTPVPQPPETPPGPPPPTTQPVG